MASGWDFIPGVGAAKRALQGDWKGAAEDVAVPGGASVIPAVTGGNLSKTRQDVTNTLGLTTDPNSLPNPANSADAQRARALADFYQKQSGRPGGVAQTIAPTMLDPTQANQARGVQTASLNDLQGVASGKTATAADSLLTQGTDAAARNAMGMAAAYSRGNPGEALRKGLAAQGQDYATAASQAAIQKAQEQAQARGEIGTESTAQRAGDTTIAKANADAANAAAASNQTAGLTQENINNQFQLGAGKIAADETNAPLKADSDYLAAITENNKANQQGTGSFFSGLGTLLSDKRAKTNVNRKSLADAYADEIHTVGFTYKKGEGDGGEHDGILAQDLEKAMPTAVKKDERGMRRVDAGHVALASAGVIAELSRRLSAIEKANRKRAA